jgi:hypothetical protein
MPSTSRTTARLAAALLAAGVGASALVATPAEAGLTIPVNCAWAGPDGLELGMDGATYQVEGVCGTVRVTADNAIVTMPTATHLYVTGTGNRVTSKSLGEAHLTGADNALASTSLTSLEVTGPRASVAVTGLAETVRLLADATTFTADRTHDVVVRGTGTGVSGRRGFRTAVHGDGNSLAYDRLDSLRVVGVANHVDVAGGRTGVTVRGTGNRVRVHRRG